MKKLFYLIVFMGSVILCNAQTSDAETEAMLNLLGVQKKEAVARLVYVTGKDSVGFWKIYDEYLKKNKEVAKSRLKLYETTARSYGEMKPALADSLAQQYFQNRINQEKSLEDYYSKIKSATNAVVAFQFYQAEVFLLTMMRASIMQQIPTYGEMAAASRKR